MGSSWSRGDEASPEKREKALRAVTSHARTSNLTMRRGYETTQRRLVARLPEGYSGKPTLKTIRNDGSIEREGPIRIHPTQSLVTYAEEQLISKEIVTTKKWDNEPSIYSIPSTDSVCGLLQMWTLDCNKKFQESCENGGIMIDLDDPKFEEKVREFEREHAGLGDDASTIDAEVKKIVAEARSRGEQFKAAAARILNTQPRAVKYCLIHKTVEEPTFIGKGIDILQFLEFDEVQKYLHVKADLGNKKFETTVFDKDRRPVGTQEYNIEKNSEQFVIYQRQGGKSFTCVNQLSQFKNEATYIQNELTENSVTEFLDTCNSRTELLGVGTYGRVDVYSKGSNEYAVKTFFNSHESADVVKEFRAIEAILLHPHPCLIQIFLMDNPSKCLKPRFVMERGYCDLQKAILKEVVVPNLSAKLKMAWLGQIFLGLERLHKMKPHPVIHRDLNPRNVIISREGYAKLTDYGCSRFSEKYDDATHGKPVGSNGYMAPELLKVATHCAHDASADLYSFGAVIYFVQTDQNAPGVGSPNEIAKCVGHHGMFRKLIEPESGNESGWQNLAKKLTETEREDRIELDEVRKHAFFKNLELPDYKEGIIGADLARKWIKKQKTPPKEQS